MMPLNDAAADLAAADVATALAALTRGEDKSADAQKIVFRAIAKMIRDNAKATLPPASVVTTGSASTQTGPASAVLLSIS